MIETRRRCAQPMSPPLILSSGADSQKHRFLTAGAGRLGVTDRLVPSISGVFAHMSAARLSHASNCGVRPPALRSKTREERGPASSRSHFALSIIQGRAVLPHEPGRELPPLVTVSDIAEFASLLGNPARASMVMALLDHDYRTARQLADAGGVTAQTASGHIAKLMDAGILARVKVGRELRHRIHSSDVEAIIRLLYLGAAKLTKRGSREIGGDFRSARNCTGHIAGKLGVELARRLTIQARDGSRTLHPDARNQLLRWGLRPMTLDLEGPACAMCEDWSEHGHHLGGGLGRAIQDRCLALGWLKPEPAGRIMSVTSAGLNGLRIRFGVEIE